MAVDDAPPGRGRRPAQRARREEQATAGLTPAALGLLAVLLLLAAGVIGSSVWRAGETVPGPTKDLSFGGLYDDGGINAGSQSPCGEPGSLVPSVQPRASGSPWDTGCGVPASPSPSPSPGLHSSGPSVTSPDPGTAGPGSPLPGPDAPPPDAPQPSETPQAAAGGVGEDVHPDFRSSGQWYRPDASGPDGDLPVQFRLPLGVPADGELEEVRGKIEIIWKGRMGNNLFSYMVGRCLHELLGFELTMSSDRGRLTKMFPDAGPKAAQKRPKGWQPQEKGVDVLFERQARMDVFGIAADRRQRTITIDAYGQQARYWKHFMAAARRWFALEAGVLGAVPTPAEDAVFVHARLGDLVRFSAQDVARGSQGLAPLPSWYWDGVLRLRSEEGYPAPSPLVVVAQAKDTGAVSLKSLLSEHKGTILSRSVEEDFVTLVLANRVLLSCSTFGWWAAALRRKAEVRLPQFGNCDPAFPIPNKGPEMVDYNPGIDGWTFPDPFAFENRPAGFRRHY